MVLAWKSVVAGWLLLGSVAAVAVQPLHHQLQVVLQPVEQRIEVVDTVTFPHRGLFEFYLHAGLQLEVEGGSVRQLDRVDDDSSPRIKRYVLTVERNTVVFHYRGDIPPADRGQFSPNGVVLEGATWWYPSFSNHLVTFELSVDMPANWRGVSQGRRLVQKLEEAYSRVVWQELSPQEEIYLIAAPFTEYRERLGEVDAMAFLRQPDPVLAQRYLEVTAHYIDLYGELIGPYPYAKFALVENVAETGYGMPSFTLLGPRVIRLPFILHSSYPHEILHNWWGNGIYVDYSQGNWAEGLTSYLADHLIQQQRGNGANFRRDILQRYADFVGHKRDFPISEFRSRHSPSSEAVGYGKTQMFFHMLRRQMGDIAFTRGLKTLYRRYLFREAGFDDLTQVFSEVTERNLAPFFDQWVKRGGAPQLQLGAVRREQMGEEWKVVLTLEQNQAAAPYALDVPLAITLAGQEEAYEVVVTLTKKGESFELVVPGRPLRIDVDPAFDIFRAVDRSEIPPALSQAFGAESMLLVLPSRADADLVQAYRQLAQVWRRMLGSEIEVVMDDQLTALSMDRAVWLLGWQNVFAPQVVSKLQRNGVTVTAKEIGIGGDRFSVDRDAVIMSARSEVNTDQALVWLAANNPRAIAGLARKLPHYRKYSYLAFSGEAPTNRLKGQWPILDSSLSAVFEPGVAPARRAVRAALAP